ncbi:MAG: 23S rRNA (adenine(2503)-C(2))-methyltransferase RlmN [Xanthomonadaceae bacterium]|nr:23S rRNA (adenine(2503)-C(2))-methyltransferase RlmN [Xanthomonadaceae bacterium]
MTELAQQKCNLKDLTRAELVAMLAGMGKERFRADQIIAWLYRHRVENLGAMTNLSRSFRKQLNDVAVIPSLECLAIETAADGTEKFLFQLFDGSCVESVLIPEQKRLTLCLSTQVGCCQGCRFCVTGRQGFNRNLKVAEIVDQVIQVQKHADRLQRRISNIVFMGMGEPLDNFDALVKAIEILKYDDGLDFSSRRITVSTCGLVPQIGRLGALVDVCLAISLNATDDEIRSRLMPINRRYNLKTLLAACRQLPLKRSSRITFEYILLKDINDSLVDASRLVRLLKPLKSKINLIPFNEHPDLPFQRPSEERISAFQAVLLASGLISIIRKSKGSDISAACGQLRGKVNSPT